MPGKFFWKILKNIKPFLFSYPFIDKELEGSKKKKFLEEKSMIIFGGMGFQLLLVAVIWIVVALALCGGVLFVMMKAIQLAKISLSLFIALILHRSNPLLAQGGFGDYLVWAAICLGVCFLICLLPRCNLAIRFVCTICVSFVITGMALHLAVEVIPAFGRLYDAHPILLEVIVRVACLCMSVVGLVSQMEALEFGIVLTNPILVNIERALASALYGISFCILCGPTDDMWNYTHLTALIVFLAAFAGTFAADFFLLKE